MCDNRSKKKLLPVLIWLTAQTILVSTTSQASGPLKPSQEKAKQAFSHAEGPAELSLVPWQQLERISIKQSILTHDGNELVQNALKVIRRSDVQHDLRSLSTPTKHGT